MRKAKRIVVAALIATIVICSCALPFAAGSQNNEHAAAPRGSAVIADKNEVVYARLSGGGEAQSIYVVNHFTLSSGGAFTDFGDYSSVVNLTDLGPLTITAGEVSAEADSGDFFYQGNLDGGDLPWVYQIEYFLDGEATPPESLAGGAGNLEIRMSSSQNNAIDEVFYDNYMQQITITLNIDKCQSIMASGAVVANAGKNRMLSYTVLPGNDADIVITANVVDFEMAAIEIAAMPFTMSFDIPETDAMLDDFTLLSDAIAELNDGVSMLSDGAAELKDGADELKNGASSINSGLARLSGNSSQLTEASAQIQGALALIAAGLSGYGGSGSDFDIADLAQLPPGLAQISDALAQISSGMNQLADRLEQAYTALDGAVSSMPDHQISDEQISSLMSIIGNGAEADILDILVDSYISAVAVKAVYEEVNPAFVSVTSALGTFSGYIDAIAAGLQDISDQIGEALSGDDTMAQIQQLIDGISELAGNYSDFHRGLVAYAQGVNELANGYGAFNSGVSDFSDGIAELCSGIGELHEGTALLEDGTSDISGQFQNEIDNLISEFLGGEGEFEAVSFTSSRNGNVSFVQFVFMTEAISKPEIDTPADTGAVPQSFWQRLANLFAPNP